MNDINLDSNKLIRNLIVACDIVIVWVVILLLARHNGMTVVRPIRLLAAGTLAMLIAQTWFSTMLHKHYSGIDKVLARTTTLMFTFSVLFATICTLHKWLWCPIVDGKTVGMTIVVASLIVLVSRMAEAMLIMTARKRGRNSRTVLFVGDSERIIDVVREIDYSMATGLRLAGYYAPEPSGELTDKMPYYGDYEQLNKDIDGHNIKADDLYCALPPSEKKLNKRIIHHCMEEVVHFYYVPTFMNEFGDYLKPSMIGRQVVFANFKEPLLSPVNRLIKRTFDIVCSGLAILCLLPFFPVIALIIKIQSPGPIFFKQARTGLGGNDFMMLKFRSMHVNADADRVQATKDDPRKYPWGNFMRKSSIDELPQLWNIFIGDMSIVGPRPHMRAHTEEYRQLIDYYMMRHYIRPGLTGWAQVTGFRGETAELWQMEGRVKRDIWYIQNWSFWLDIRIIFRTAWQVLGKDKQAY